MTLNLLTVEEAMRLPLDKKQQLYKKHINPIFVQMLNMLGFDRNFVKAMGSSIYDAEGNKYLDFLGGFGAVNFGHNDPVIESAIQAAKEYPNILQVGVNPFAAVLAHNLALVTPGELEVSFFCNSGTEAVEGALKLAKKVSKRHRILYSHGSFHGKTAGALSVTGRKKYRLPFEPLVPLCDEVPYNDLEKLEIELKKNNVAAYIVEPVQGEGGVIVPANDYLTGVRALCTKYNALLIVDEVQTGLGRTGRNFACQRADVTPDIMCLAKSLGGGIYPIGAYITTKKLWHDAYGKFDDALLHTSTFGGNSLACAAGIASVCSLVNNSLAQQAEKKGAYLLDLVDELAKRSSLIEEVRGVGLLIGIQFKRPIMFARPLEKHIGSLVASYLFSNRRIITAYTLNNPSVIRLEPPLTVSYEEIEYLADSLKQLTEDYGSLKGLLLGEGKQLAQAMLEKRFVL